MAKEHKHTFVCEDCGHTKYMPLQLDDKSNPDM